MEKIYVITYKTTAGIEGMSLIARKNKNDAEAAARELEKEEHIQSKSVQIRLLILK